MRNSRLAPQNRTLRPAERSAVDGTKNAPDRFSQPDALALRITSADTYSRTIQQRSEGGRQQALPAGRRLGRHGPAPSAGLGPRVSFCRRGARAPFSDRPCGRCRQPADQARPLHRFARGPGPGFRKAPGADHPGQDAAGDRRPDRARRAVVREGWRSVAASSPGGRLQPDLRPRPHRADALGIGRGRGPDAGAPTRHRPSSFSASAYGLAVGASQSGCTRSRPAPQSALAGLDPEARAVGSRTTQPPPSGSPRPFYARPTRTVVRTAVAGCWR
jgi:hypothetical protein